jgi:hypothetical protein
MEKERSNILAVYDWFKVVCSGEVSWQVSGILELRNLNIWRLWLEECGRSTTFEISAHAARVSLKTNIGEKHYVFCIFHRVRSFRYHKEIVLSLHVEYERRSIVWLSAWEWVVASNQRLFWRHD